MNEITRADNDRVEQLLQQLKLRLPATQFQRVANFIHVDRIDPYTTLKDIGEHLKMQFPELFQEVPVTDEAVIREQEDDTPEAKEYVDQFSDPKWLELKKLLLPAVGTVTAIPPPKGTPGKPQTQGYQSWKTPHGTIYVETTKTTPMKLTLNFGFANSIYAKQEKVKQLQDFFDRMHVRDTGEEWNGADVQAGATIAMDNIPAAAKIINDAVKILSSDQLAAESRIRLKDLVMEIKLDCMHNLPETMLENYLP